MKEIKFNTPLYNPNTKKNVIRFLNQKKSIHGPGANILGLKKKIKKLYNFKHIHLTNSCTSALEICALLIKLKPKDEVILPSYSFITTASSFARTGCSIKYCDIDKETLMPLFSDITKCVNKNTKAIVIVHYQGFSVNYLDKLKNFCKRKKIFLIEDAAQAFGSYFKKKPLGSFGDFSCFSFHETKNIHSGAGGMLVVNNLKYLPRSNIIFDKGSDRYLVINKKQKYYSWVENGSSFLLTELSASYLLPQLHNYQNVINYRSRLYKRYVENFSNWVSDEFYICNNYIYKYNYHALVIILKKNNRDKLLDFLKKYKIYPFIGYIPLHQSKAGKKYLMKNQKLKNTNLYGNKTIRLPLHNKLNVTDIDFITNKIKSFFNK